MLGVPAPKVAMTQADLRAANRLDRLDLISARPDAAAGGGLSPAILAVRSISFQRRNDRPLPRGVLCEVREFGQSGLEGICSSLHHYPGEQRVVGRQVAQASDVGLDAGRDDLEKGRRGPVQPYSARNSCSRRGRPMKSVKPSSATTWRACSGTQLNATNAASHAAGTGPAMSQSKNPASLASRHTAL
jgi:hypothetical protein